ncbi:MAG: SEC-C domain-containing protein [Chthonomonadales bacterium]|nr:SEC-C domain-containing protein [Chthonomonadales bacterium]
MVDWLRRLVDSNERDIARYRAVVERVNALEPEVERLSNAQFRGKTDEFRAQVQNGWQSGLDAMRSDGLSDTEVRDRSRKALDEILDAVLPEAFAVVREAARRTLGQRAYDVQLIGGMAAHDGRIAELKTGEGKTLMATLPLYLNALAGRGAHLVTANDYLSKVGAVWMGPVYDLLGMSVGIIQGQSPETGDEGGSYIYDPTYEDPDPRFTFCRPISRREAYACDVTYGTNNEFGFDYLRDNMAFHADDLSMRELHYAIIDEVDSILIDEARTPLIISGFVDQDTSMYYKVDRVIRQLRGGKDSKTQQERDDPNADRNNPNIHYLVDEKAKTVAPSDAGVQRIEAMLGVRNLADDPQMMHYVTAAMKAQALFRKDIDYVVRDGEIIIVDEFTGRLMFGRRYSDGLHQAIEAKEGVEIKHESQTLATITFQNLFRLYLKLAGMTGTAKTEEDEFRKIYGLDVVVVPTNRPMVRADRPDVIYKVQEHKFRGIAAEILRLYAKQQPVLVGTRSIEMSEKVSSRITYDSLQVLCMVSIIRARMEASKMDKAQREKWNESLNQNLDALTVGKLTPMIRELGLPSDPLNEANEREILQLLELEANEETLANLDEALRHGIPHNVLNAKYHEKEAIIIAEAGRKGAITIATNMAGRGVDILLGGKPQDQQLPPGQDTSLTPEPAAVNGVAADEAKPDVEGAGPEGGEGEEAPAVVLLSYRRGGKRSVLDTVTTLTPEEHSRAADEVRAVGGLFILGTERHESRRIDNQLRGRSGRQGDPGESRFFVSLEDELWRLFGDRSQHPLLRTWPEDQMMDARILSRMIERAQKKVEEHHFEMRNHVLKYDDVRNKQREVIYAERRRVLRGADLRETILGFLRHTVSDAVRMFCSEAAAAQDWDLDELYNGLDQYFPLSRYAQPSDLTGRSRADVEDFLLELVEKAYADKESELVEAFGDESAMRELERRVALQVVNQKWMEHLANMDYLQEGINLRGYGQQDPLVVYNKEAFEMFEDMQHSIQDEIARFMFHVQPVVETRPRPRQYTPLPADDGGQASTAGVAGPRAQRKLGRNDACWCGSGKKYKHCHYPD